MKKFLNTFFLFSSFSFVAFAEDLNLQFPYPVQISTPSADGLKPVQSVAAGQDVKIDDSQLYWLESPGKVPVLVIPKKLSGNEPTKLQLPDVASWPPTAVSKEIENRMAQLMDLMTQFQIEMSKKNLSAAEQLLARMTSIQNGPSLEFLRAYLAYMRGDFNRARAAVKKGLETYPNHVQGLQLLKTLDGGKSE